MAGLPVDFDEVPISEGVMKVPGRRSNATHDAVFLAKNIPPLGLVNYYVETLSENKPLVQLQPVNNDTDVVIDNGVSKNMVLK